MNNATRVSILFTLLAPLGLVVHASDAPWVIAQVGLPGQLPGQKLPGQLPGPSSAPPKPATAALPSTGAALPVGPCCSITAINKATGIVAAREKSGGRTIEIKATPAQVQNLRVGQDLFANLETRQASLDGKTLCCGLSFAAATPSPAFPATTLSRAPVVPPGGSSPMGSSSSAAGAAPSPKPTPSPTPSGGKDSGPTKPTVAGKGGSRNTDFPNVDTRTINASEGSTAQAIRGVTAASPPTPSAPQSPVKQLVPTKTASADLIKPGSSPAAAQQQLPGKATLGAPQLPGKAPEPASRAVPTNAAGGVHVAPATGMTLPNPTTSTPAQGSAVGAKTTYDKYTETIQVTGLTGEIPSENLGVIIRLYLTFKWTSPGPLKNLQWRIYKASGPGQFDSGVQTISSVESYNGSSSVNVIWTPVEGSHRFVGVIDPNNQIPESPDMRANNSKTLDVTIGTRMRRQAIDPKEAGAPGTLAVNMQDSNGCKGKFTPDSGSVVVELIAPYPLPIPFPGCSMKPEFYKGVQLKNGWHMQESDLKESFPGVPSPPNAWSWLKSPAIAGDSPYGQALLSLPSRSTACTSSYDCWTSVSARLTMHIKGPAATNPYRPTISETTVPKPQVRP